VSNPIEVKPNIDQEGKTMSNPTTSFVMMRFNLIYDGGIERFGLTATIGLAYLIKYDVKK
jgi:hypothetical protein